jgi:putative DNA primase/helicase
MNASIHTGPTAEDLARIPDALKALDQWILWRGVERLDQQTGEVRLNKIPIDPRTLHNADTTDPLTWGTLDQCVAALPVVLEGWEGDDPSTYRGGGLGFVFTQHDPYAGVDLDHCCNADTGQVAAWAQAHIDALASYTEVTPSRTGLHILVQGALPPRGRKKGHVEMYDTMRFFTVTGWHVDGTPRTIEARQEALQTFHTAIFGTADGATPNGTGPHTPTTPALDDAVILDKARAARNGAGARFTALWSAETRGYSSQSEADLGLCVKLAFWTQDAIQIDRLFRQSGLIRPKWDEQRGAQTYGERTVAEALARQTSHYRPKRDAQHRRNGNTPKAAEQPPASHDAPLPYSDLYNARALVLFHGDTLRYCFPWKSWLTWTGTHWQRDTSGAVMRLAKATIKLLARQVEDLDEKEAKALLAHIKGSLAATKLKAMMELAQSEPGIPVQPEDLDADRWLLNCANGTLDLQTGTLRPQRQADLLSKCLPLVYDPDATCPTWERFLWRIMGGSQGEDSPDMPAGELENRRRADDRAKALIDFVQRAVGYSLTGSTREQCIFILHGPTKTGKSTFLATLRALLGPYGRQADMESFMHKDRQEVRNDLADLAGSRVVCALESQEGRRLSENLIKQMTGGVDIIKARFLFQEYFEYQPQFKIFLGTNHKPVICDTDSAIWERIRLVPFTIQIPKPERDKTLDEQLHKELPGILAWAVRGCLEWQRFKELQEPEAVEQATQAYRDEMDDVGRFLHEVCFVGAKDTYQVQASLLLKEYHQWCGQNVMTGKAFAKALTDKGYDCKHTKTGTKWLGIGLPAAGSMSTGDR